jgi:hypothetical protein
MNIALVLQHKLWLGLQRFLSGAHQSQTLQVQPRVGSLAAPHLVPTPCLASARKASHTAVTGRQLAAKVMPLRVLRVVDTDMPRSSTGRLVISGRMADVCAELDRLVEREAALH